MKPLKVMKLLNLFCGTSFSLYLLLFLIPALLLAENASFWGGGLGNEIVPQKYFNFIHKISYRMSQVAPFAI